MGGIFPPKWICEVIKNICYRLNAHKICPRIVIPIGTFFWIHICAISKNDLFWSLWFLCTHCLGLVFFQFANWQKKNFSFSALKKGTHKFASNARNGIVSFLAFGAFVACSLTCFWTGIQSHNNARTGIDHRSSCFRMGTRLHNNARIRIADKSSLFDFARIGILMREPFVNRDECLCANGEC